MLHLWYHFCWGTVEQTKDHPLCHLKLLRSVQCREQNGSQKIDYQGKLVSLVVNICHQILLKEEYSQTKNLVGRPGIQLVILNWELKTPYSKVFLATFEMTKMPLSSREAIIDQLLALRDIPGNEQVFCLCRQRCPLNLQQHLSLQIKYESSLHAWIYKNKNYYYCYQENRSVKLILV